MKNLIADLIFNKKFKDEISRESLKRYKDLKKNEPALGTAVLIAYLLKFKQEILRSKTNPADFDEIKRESLELFRQNKASRLSFSRSLRITATACILLIFAVGGYLIGKTNLFSDPLSQSKVVEFNTLKGQQAEVTLPDGTFVALNYDSKLKYRITGEKDLQLVELEGEAFFKVKKNRSRTFRVVTADMNVNVFGTEFNVKTYKNDAKTETILLEGSIEIKGIPGDPEPVLLQPGEKWTYDRTTCKHAVTRTDTLLSTRWRNGEYYFDKISLDELEKTLERMYNVAIHFQDPSLGKEVYTGSIYQEDNIKRIFDIINLSVPISVKIKKNEIWVTRK